MGGREGKREKVVGVWGGEGGREQEEEEVGGGGRVMGQE